MKQVLLLRTPVSDEGDGDAEGSADPYEAEFRSRGYHAVTVPLLRHELSLEGLESILLGTDNPADAYLGVVVTSKRGVEALVSAHNNLAARFPEFVAKWSAWKSLPFFAVGPSTSSRLEAQLFVSAHGSPPGDALRLARILKSFRDSRSTSTSTAARPPPFLFLCGERRRDALKKELEDSIVEVVVYVANRDPMADERLRAAIQSTEYASDGTTAIVHEAAKAGLSWVVLFAPSNLDPETPSILESMPPQVRLAAIGKTTAEAISKCKSPALPNVAQRLHAVATSPNPKALVDAIVAADAVAHV